MSDASYEDDIPEQMRVRREKLDRLRAEGVDPYPVGFPRTTTIAAVREEHKELAAGGSSGESVGITGRVVLNRPSGKLCFATIRDGSGDIQLMLSLAKVGQEALDAWKRDVDLGDHVGVEGEVVASKRGELSIMVDRWSMTSKCLRPLPEKHAGLTDPESRVRLRYVDLIVNEDSRDMARIRSHTVRAIREFMQGQSYMEVETPMLQPVHGGATARPFTTHINAYDMELYLRIAPELYLKRLLVGGLEKVFEINRNFRNEGADATHSPEFTMLEAYEAYGDYYTMADLVAGAYRHVAREVFGTTVIKWPGEEIDLAEDWPWLSLYTAVSEAVGTEVTPDTSAEELRKHFDARELSFDPAWGPGKLVEELFEALVEHAIVRPTYVCDYPVETSPLTRQKRDDPRVTEKFDLIGFGTELGTAYSELVDPVEQRRRLTEQSLLAAGGDPEAMQLDEDFLRALEFAMPPAGGIGFGIDRMLKAFTGKNIRETILFPFVKPH